MGECPLGCSLNSNLVDSVTIVIDDVHGPGETQHVDQRGHREQNRIRCLAGIPDQCQTDEGTGTTHKKDHEGDLDAAESKERECDSQYK